jgi:hypothetical protein
LSDARTPTAHTHPAAQISDSTAAGRSILTAADAAAQRTALGLGSAAVRAATDFPRFDVIQSPTLASEIIARANLGFGDSFTTSQFLALDATDSARLRIAYCSDCLSSSPNAAVGVGDMCLWDTGRSQWITFFDRVPITTSFITYALALFRRGLCPWMTPVVSIHGDDGNFTSEVNGFNSGTGAGHTVHNTSPASIQVITASPGTTSSGSFKGYPIPGIQAAWSLDPVRSFAIIMSYRPAAQAVSILGTDNWHWRMTIQTPLYSASAAKQVDEVGFVMDDANTLGEGATGSTLRALIRLDGTTLDWVDSGVNPTSDSKFLIVAFEPTGPASRQGLFTVATADSGGATITTVASRNGSFSAASSNALLPCITGAKTLGTASRFFARRGMAAVTYRRTAGGGILT